MIGSDVWLHLGVGAVLFSLGVVYALQKNRIHDLYSPDWIWVTVVGGMLLIGSGIAWYCAIGMLPWLAFWLLVWCSAAPGLAIVGWQEIQRRTRHVERNGNGEESD